MKQYRKSLEIDLSVEYAWVHLGPIAGLPDWHLDTKPSSYPFPSDQAAMRFGKAHAAEYPGRDMRVVTVNGEEFDLTVSKEKQ